MLSEEQQNAILPRNVDPAVHELSAFVALAPEYANQGPAIDKPTILMYLLEHQEVYMSRGVSRVRFLGTRIQGLKRIIEEQRATLSDDRVIEQLHAKIKRLEHSLQMRRLEKGIYDQEIARYHPSQLENVWPEQSAWLKSRLTQAHSNIGELEWELDMIRSDLLSLQTVTAFERAVRQQQRISEGPSLGFNQNQGVVGVWSHAGENPIQERRSWVRKLHETMKLRLDVESFRYRKLLSLYQERRLALTYIHRLTHLFTDEDEYRELRIRTIERITVYMVLRMITKEEESVELSMNNVRRLQERLGLSEARDYFDRISNL